jgi:hypothetical protein
MSNPRFSRRYFFFGSLLAGAVPAGGFGSVPSLSALGYKSYNSKLNVAGIGVGTRGPAILGGVAATENIVALCDVNDVKAAPAYRRYEKAKRYKDFRKMLESEGNNIDAVMIATPDHTHTPVALYCMQHGKHVYCEKPLARTTWENRLLARAAVKYKLATQMGNQGYSHEGTRTAAEILWSGAIGSVKEVHSWTGGQSSLQTAPSELAVPATLDWDLWLSTAAKRPYSPMMVDDWRAFLDFSTGGSMGDWGIHTLGPVNLALQLTAPTSVECVKVDGKSRWTWPARSYVRFEFPARGDMPPVVINFYQNMTGEVKVPDGLDPNEPILPRPGNLSERGRFAPGEDRRAMAMINGTARPLQQPNRPQPRVSGSGALFVGDKGYMATVERGEGVWLLPASRWKDYRLPPQLLPRSVTHEMDWVRACKGGQPACSNFEIAAPYVEWVALGAVATRVPGKLLWDTKAMRFTNSAEADQLIRPYIRKGWDLKL